MKTSARGPPQGLESMSVAPALSASLPSEGFVRLPQILAVFPVSPAHFWDGIRQGIFPAGLSLSPKITVWAVEDVRRLVAFYKERAEWKPWEPPAEVEREPPRP